jgi:hypothetical protein
MTARHQRPGLRDFEEAPAVGWGLLVWIVVAALAGIALWAFVVLTLVSLAGMQ